jgi:putative transposase
VIQKARWFGRLRVIFADAAYNGQLVTWVREFFGRQGTHLSIVPRLGHGFRLLAKRWIVERTFSWLTHYRRLTKDYEVKTEHSEAFIYAAAARLMLRRLASSPPKGCHELFVRNKAVHNIHNQALSLGWHIKHEAPEPITRAI